jgi:hypothetical protein
MRRAVDAAQIHDSGVSRARVTGAGPPDFTYHQRGSTASWQQLDDAGQAVAGLGVAGLDEGGGALAWALPAAGSARAAARRSDRTPASARVTPSTADSSA